MPTDNNKCILSDDSIGRIMLLYIRDKHFQIVCQLNAWIEDQNLIDLSKQYFTSGEIDDFNIIMDYMGLSESLRPL